MCIYLYASNPFLSSAEHDEELYIPKKQHVNPELSRAEAVRFSVG